MRNDEKKPDSMQASPLHNQLKDILLNKILSCEWSNGEKIPNEYRLCEIYNVSRITVRQALAELTRRGYLQRRQGSGTYVSIPKIEHNLASFYSFSEEFRKRGLASSSCVLEFHLQIAQKEIAHKLELQDRDREVYYIKRLRCADSMPVAIESTYLPAVLFNGLKEEELDSRALYDVMRERFGVIPSNAEEIIDAVNLEEKEAFYLGVKKDTAVFRVERFTHCAMKCIEYTIGFVRSDFFRFHVKLEKP